MRHAIIVFLLSLFCSEHTPAQTWKMLEIPLAGCSYIAQNPWQPDELFFLHHGMIVTTTDLGATWEYKSFCDFVDQRPVSITFDSEDPDRWYLPMGAAGLMITTDGGRTYSFKNEDLNPYLDYLEVIQHPTNPDVLYLRGNGIIQRSSDRGETWPETLLLLSINKEEAAGFIIDEDDPTKLYVYASGLRQYYVSEDEGASWEIYPIEPGNYSRITKCIDGSIWGNNARSTDNGKTWVRYKEMEGYDRDFFGSMCQVVYDAEHELYFLASSNQGVYRAKKGEWIWKLTSLTRYVDSSRFGQIPWIHFDDRTHALWVVMRNELYISLDHGEHFEVVSGGPFLGNTSYLTSPSPQSNIIIGNTVATLDNGETWMYNGAGLYYLQAGAVSPIDSLFFVKGSGTPSFTAQGFKGFNNLNFGYRFVPFAVLVYKTLKFNPHDPHQLFGGGIRGFWRLTDSMIINTWDRDPSSQLITPWPEDEYYTMDFDFHPERDGEYFLATWKGGGALYNNCYIKHSTDFGKSWEELYFEEGNVINEIIVHPENPDLILCASNRGILRSTDAGTTWTKNNSPPFEAAYIQTIEIDPRMPNMVYCGAFGVRYKNDDPYTGKRRGGMYVSSDYGETWDAMPLDGMYNYSVNLIHYHENPRRLIISTRGGIYETLLPDVVNVAETAELPEQFEIKALYPNPAHIGNATSLKYRIPEACEVRVDLYDALGRKVQELSSGRVMPGTYSLHFIPQVTVQGMYFVHVVTANGIFVKKLLLEQ